MVALSASTAMGHVIIPSFCYRVEWDIYIYVVVHKGRLNQGSAWPQSIHAKYPLYCG